MKQGTKANLNGENAEKDLETLLKSYGFAVFTYSDFNKNPNIVKNFNYYAIRQYPYETVYDKAIKKVNPEYKSKSRLDFKLFNKVKNTVANIELKEQTVNGSADEKIPFCLENLYNSHANMGILVLEGNGFKKGVKLWAKSIIESGKYKNGNCENVHSCDSIEETMKIIIDEFV